MPAIKWSSIDVRWEEGDAWATSADLREKNVKLSNVHKEPSPTSRPDNRSFTTPSPSAPIPVSLRSDLPLLQSSPPPTSMPPSPPHLLVCSLGNPGAAYANTLHSAGHIVLSALATHLNFPAFSKDRSLGNGRVSRPPADAADPAAARWTLWSSPAYMNESGKPVRAAWTAFKRDVASKGGRARLVVVHDELDRGLGLVGVRTKVGASARGHNGIKSVMGVMGEEGFVRVGVGIGRPESRDSNVVAGYVLRKMGRAETDGVEGSVAEVVRRLKEVDVDD